MPIKASLMSRASAFCLLLGLSGCVLLPRPTGNAVINKQLSSTSVEVQRTSNRNFHRCEYDEVSGACHAPMFVGVAISGGGARAANFGIAALRQLQALDLYPEVTALSSVSGGSLAATSFALQLPQSDDQMDHLKDTMRTDFLSRWLAHAGNPVNLLRSVGSGRNATRSLADVFDETVFNSARFRDLGKPGKGAPRLFINSSIVNNLGGDQPYTTRAENAPADQLQGFTFTSEAFAELGSDLGELRLADAVAASGAYPAVFDTLTVQDYSVTPGDYQRPQFLHLTDGGPADNLGVDALVQAYGKAMFSNPDASCLLIVIDAHVTDRLEQSGALADTRQGMMDYVISPAFARTFDLLLDRRREDQLYRLGIKLADDFPVRFIADANIPLDNLSFSSNGLTSAKGRSMYKGKTTAGPGSRPYTTAHCAVWHIALDRLMELTAQGGRRYSRAFYKWPKEEDLNSSDYDRSLFQLDRFVNSIQTNYRLALNNGSGCNEKLIQNSLFSAAEQLMRRDDVTLHALSTWLREHRRADLAQAVDGKRQAYAERYAAQPAAPVPAFEIGDSLFNPLTKKITCSNN